MLFVPISTYQIRITGYLVRFKSDPLAAFSFWAQRGTLAVLGTKTQQEGQIWIGLLAIMLDQLFVYLKTDQQMYVGKV